MLTKRLFVGYKIILNEKPLLVFDKLKANLKNENINWVNPDNIHITLKFIGETDINRIQQIKSVISVISENTQLFDLYIKSTGAFSNYNNPKVVWFGMSESQNLLKLFNELNIKLETLGFEPEIKPFKAHITLGRIKFIKDKINFKKIVTSYSDEVYQKINVDNIELFESILTPGGSNYKSLQRFDFKSKV